MEPGFYSRERGGGGGHLREGSTSVDISSTVQSETS